jgi:hypothetical protein
MYEEYVPGSNAISGTSSQGAGFDDAERWSMIDIGL